jgi:phosphomevalonate kinase
VNRKNDKIREKAWCAKIQYSIMIKNHSKSSRIFTILAMATQTSSTLRRPPLTFLLGGGAAVVVLYLLHRRRRALTACTTPRIVIVFSGKRKSGKDYLCERLEKFFGADKAASPGGAPQAAIGRLSGPLKKAYADEHNLNFKELLSDGPYKEKYRKDMIAWGVARRTADPGYFPRLVLAQTRPMPPILIISDARRATDLAFFKDDPRWKCLSVRVMATEETRAGRGWKFTPGVDDVDSETGLDGRADWDIVINNNQGDGSRHIERIVDACVGFW